jgi:hypothetical protein
MYELSDYPLRMLKLSNIIGKATASDDLVLTSLGPSLPEVLYYSDRKGWHIGLSKATVGELRNYRKNGCQWFAWLQPNIKGFFSSYRKGVSLQSLLEYLQKKKIDVNYCLGDGLGFCGIINLQTQLNDDLPDSGNVPEIARSSLLQTIVTGEGIDSIVSNLQINAFILPYRESTDNPQKILDDTVYREKMPELSRISHAICLFYSGRETEARLIISDVVEKWPSNKLALFHYFAPIRDKGCNAQ